MNYTISILNSIVSNIRNSESITNIVDNLNGTYTITANVGYLRNLDFVTIADTTGFDGVYQISSITSSTFDITKATGTAIPLSFGTWTANAPYFQFSEWFEADRKLMEKGESSTYKFQKFPLVFLKLPVSESVISNVTNNYTINSFNLYIFVETDETKDTSWRNTNTMPELRELETRFVSQFRKYVVGAMNYTRTELFYDIGTANRFNSPVDAILLRFDDTKIIVPQCSFETY